MKRIELFEKAIAEQAKSLEDYGINPTLFWAYRTSAKAENELIDFDQVIRDDEVEQVANACKKHCITEFTISSTWSSLINELAKFDEQGFKMAGIVSVNELFQNIVTGEREKKPAILMKMEEA